MVLFKTLIFLAICAHQTLAATNQTWTNSGYPGYKIAIVDLGSGISDTVVKNLRGRFWSTYPAMVNDFNPNAVKSVKFIFDKNLSPSVPAYASGGDSITFSTQHLANNPNDLDIVVHEGFHLIQIDFDECPGYLIEGLADFVRDRYGLSNAATGWQLPTYSIDQYFKNGYGEMAVLIKYLEEQGHSNAGMDLFNACKDGAGYNDDEDQVWRDLFGKSPRDTWKDYATENLPAGCFE